MDAQVPVHAAFRIKIAQPQGDSGSCRSVKERMPEKRSLQEVNVPGAENLGLYTP